MCVSLYFIILFINSEFLNEYHKRLELSFFEENQIDYYQTLGMMAGLILLMISFKFIKLKHILLIPAALYLLSIIGIIFTNVTQLSNMGYYFLYSLSITLIGVSILSDTMCHGSVKANIKLFLLTAIYVVTYFFIKAQSSPPYDNTEFDLIDVFTANVIPVILFVIVLIKLSAFEEINFNEEDNFLTIVKNAELEIITGFSLFYILAIVVDGYYLYSTTDFIYSIINKNEVPYILLGLLPVFGLVLFLFEKLGIHKLNITAITTMLLLFAGMSYLGKHAILAVIFWSALIIAFYTLFAGGISLLSQKFDGADCKTAILLYFMAGFIGNYCGYITTKSYETILDEGVFLIPIYFVLFTLLVYYAYLFNKRKLYR
ncbi:MAG: hypothetical protein Tsb006_4500 [Rickettsiaceae bacterium]